MARRERASQVTLGGRQVAVPRLRVRSDDGEEPLPSFRWAAATDPLDEHTLAAVAAGVSTRRYAGTLDPTPAEVAERGTSSSAVSRRFVALSAKRLRSFLSRPLDELDLRVVCIDGKVFRDHCMVVALGIDTQGRKHVLGLREGATETAVVTSGLLSDLVTRGLPTDRTLLFVIDGAPGLRRAITDVERSSRSCRRRGERALLALLPPLDHGQDRRPRQRPPGQASRTPSRSHGADVQSSTVPRRSATKERASIEGRWVPAVPATCRLPSAGAIVGTSLPRYGVARGRLGRAARPPQRSSARRLTGGRRPGHPHGLPPQLVNRGRRHAAHRAASAGPHTSAPRRRVEDRPRRDTGAHRRDLVVTTYAMLTRQPWLADVFILSLKAGGIWWNPAVENQATDRARFASASTATCSSTSS